MRKIHLGRSWKKSWSSWGLWQSFPCKATNATHSHRKWLKQTMWITTSCSCAASYLQFERGLGLAMLDQLVASPWLCVWKAAALVCTCDVPSSMVYLRKSQLSWGWEQLLCVNKVLDPISVGPALFWGGAVVLETLVSHCVWSTTALRTCSKGPGECCCVASCRICQASCRQRGRSSFIFVLLQIMGMIACFAQDSAAGLCGRARRSVCSNLGVSYLLWLYQFNSFQM